MDLNLGDSVWVGLAATGVMTVVMYALPVVGLPRTDVTLILGSMLRLPRNRAPYYGALMHFGMGVVFAFLYAFAFLILDVRPNWWIGLLAGVVHWALVMLADGPVRRRSPRDPSGAHEAPRPLHEQPRRGVRRRLARPPPRLWGHGGRPLQPRLVKRLPSERDGRSGVVYDDAARGARPRPYRKQQGDTSMEITTRTVDAAGDGGVMPIYVAEPASGGGATPSSSSS